ncbi:MAG: undecaprenyl-diphosphate phosphatase [Candidatus Binatia bacterium]
MVVVVEDAGLTIWQAMILGVIQGLTEFLPISSDGHLVIAQEIFGLRPPNAVAFDVLLHLGTLVAVVVYFRRELLEMLAALFGASGAQAEVRRRWIWLLGLGTVPVAIVGLLLEDWFAETFHSIVWAGTGLLITGTILWLVHGKGATGRTEGELTVRDALLVGGIQSFALLPGVSRSGTTLFAALSSGIERTTAARFSFLLSIPAITGALVLKFGDMMVMAQTGSAAPLIVGPLAAGLTGLLAIEVLMRAVRRGSLRGFSVYCWTVGALTLAWSLVGN